MIEDLFNKLDMYLDDHCLFFWHDFRDTKEPVKGMQSSEQYYWTHQRCLKCKAERAVSNI